MILLTLFLAMQAADPPDDGEAEGELDTVAEALYVVQNRSSVSLDCSVSIGQASGNVRIAPAREWSTRATADSGSIACAAPAASVRYTIRPGIRNVFVVQGNQVVMIKGQ